MNFIHYFHMADSGKFYHMEKAFPHTNPKPT